MTLKLIILFIGMTALAETTFGSTSSPGPKCKRDTALKESRVQTIGYIEHSKKNGEYVSMSKIGFSPNGEHILSASTGLIKVVEAKTLRPVFSINAGPRYLTGVDFSSDGEKILLGATDLSDSSTKVYSAKSGKLIWEKGSESDRASISVKISPDSKYFAIGARDVTEPEDFAYLQLGDLKSGKKIWEIKYEFGDPTTWAISFSPDKKRLLLADYNGVIDVIDLKTGETQYTINHDVDPLYNKLIMFSPDGRNILTSSFRGGIKIRDGKSGNLLRRLEAVKAAYAVTYSPSGKHILTGANDHRVRVFEAKSAKVLLESDHHGGPVWNVAYSADGKYFSTGSNDKTASIWDAKTGKVMAKISHKYYVPYTAFSPDRNYFISGGGPFSSKKVQFKVSDISSLDCL